MTGADRRLAALIATFAASRSEELLRLIGAPSGDAMAKRVRALGLATREARLAELARVLAAADEPGRVEPPRTAVPDGRDGPGGLSRIRRRLALERLRAIG